MTTIEWTDESWNPTHGCDKVSPGCDNCYALTMARRLKGMGQASYQNDGDPRTSGPGFALTLAPERLTIPLRWRTPRKVFVNSMSDLFHADVPDDFIARVFAVMAAAPQHTFQLLTKRHSRMRALVNRPAFTQQVGTFALKYGVDLFRDDPIDPGDPRMRQVEWPLPNVWLGVSVEDQQWAEIRIPALLATPAAVRWISAEPLLGPLWLGKLGELQPIQHGSRIDFTGLQWVVAGGESGPGARPMHIGWARSLRDQCRDLGIPFLFKQWGQYDQYGLRVGKTAAGRELDGRTHDDYPDLEVAHA